MVTAAGKLNIKPTITGGGSPHVVLDITGYFVPGAP
jgi:hypothetical protein